MGQPYKCYSNGLVAQLFKTYATHVTSQVQVPSHSFQSNEFQEDRNSWGCQKKDGQDQHSIIINQNDKPNYIRNLLMHEQLLSGVVIHPFELQRYLQNLNIKMKRFGIKRIMIIQFNFNLI